MKSINRRQMPHVSVAAGVLLLSAQFANAQTVIDVGYAPAQNKATFEDVAQAFSKEHPGITVRLRAAPSYPELTQQILREALVGGAPDVSHQAYSQIRVLVDRNLAVPLDSFIGAEKDWESRGYASSISSMGQVKGRLYGMPFWTSLPAVFYNADLVRRAGGDPGNFPSSWPEILALGKKIGALGKEHSGFYYIYKNTDWPLQALVYSEGGTLLTQDESDVAFNNEPGIRAFRQLAEFAKSGMADMTREQARQAFAAGALGILVDASSLLPNFEKQAGGRFVVGVAVHPVPAADGRLPAGGNAMVILTKDPQKQKAAWEYIKFASGPVGQTLMVKNTGALPVSLAATKQQDLLGQFYSERPNQRALLAALPKMTGWYAFPGANANKIVSLIEDGAERVATSRASPERVSTDLAREVKSLLSGN
jgi:multiple sugar transport system substrate-binding protein